MARLKRMAGELCKKCELWKTSRSNCINGRGSKTPKIMFVGQAPGEEEDLADRTFTGPTAELLADVLDEVGIDELQCRFETVVRCRPSNDKKPLKIQTVACYNNLVYSIKKYKPEYIIPMGAVALKILTGLDKIKDFGGAIFEMEGQKYFPVLHPSAALHEKRQLGEFLGQMMSLAKMLNNRPRLRKRPKYELVTEKFIAGLSIAELDKDRLMVLDLETSGLDPFMKDARVRCVGISQVINRATCFSTETKEMHQQMRRFLGSRRKFIAHNAKYDFKWSKVHFGVEPNIVEDTAILAHLIEEEYSVKLQTCSAMYTDMVDHKGSFTYFRHVNGYSWDDVPFDDLGEYNCGDCDATLRVFRNLRKKVTDNGMERLYTEVDIPAMRTLARIELRGMAIDKRLANRLIGQAHERMTEIRKIIERNKGVRIGMVRSNLDELNLNSSVQINDLFYKWWKLRPGNYMKRLGSGQFSTDKYAIDILAETYPDKMALIKEHRGLSHAMSDIEIIIEKAKSRDGLDLINCDYTQTFVVTGRLSSRDPNLQNLPNPKELTDDDDNVRKFGDAVKKIFISRFGVHGGIMNADYSQLELRLVANESKDPTYIKALNEKDDLHTITARHLPGVDPDNITKEQRFIGKRLNFAVVYGAGAGELAKNFRKPKEECQEYLDSYYETYPYVRQYMEDLHDFCREKGYVVSKFGRRRHLPEINEEDWWTAKRAMNQAGNFPIASMGADLTKWAMAMIDQEMVDQQLKSIVIGQVHDSIIFDYYKREFRRVQEIVRYVMVELAMETWDFFKSVPLVVDISVGPNWLEQDEVGAKV